MRFKIYNHCVGLIIALIAITHCFAQSTPLNQEKIQSIIDQHKDLLEHVQSVQTINNYCKKGEYLAQHYTEQKFLEPFINPEEFHKKQQRIFNEKLIVSIPLPAHVQPGSIGLYYGDALHAAHLGISWGIEWCFYKLINYLIIQSIISSLQNNTSPITALQSHKYLSSTIISVLLSYAIITVTIKHSTNYFLLNEPLNAGPNNSMPLSSLLSPATLQTITTHITPQSWTTMINALFKKFDLLPAWSELTWVEITKEFVILVLWFRWFTNTHIQPSLLDHIKHNEQAIIKLHNHIQTISAHQPQTAQDKQELCDTHKALIFFINDTMHTSFSSWLMYKTSYLNFGHGVANIIIILPSLYRLSMWLYSLYKATKTQSIQGYK